MITTSTAVEHLTFIPQFAETFLLANAGQVGEIFDPKNRNILGNTNFWGILYGAGYALNTMSQPKESQNLFSVAQGFGVSAALISENCLEPTLEADAVISAQLIYKGTRSLLAGISPFSIGNEIRNSPKGIISTLHGIYSISQGVFRILKWLPINALDYVKTHPTAIRMANSLQSHDNKNYNSEIDQFASHPNILREIQEHSNRTTEFSPKRLIDVALEKIEQSAKKDSVYASSFYPILTNHKYTVSAQLSRAADHNRAFAGGTPFYSDIPVHSEITRTSEEICKLLEKVRNQSGNLVEDLIIEGHGTLNNGMRLGVNSEITPENIMPLVKCIHDHMKPDAHIILNGCSTAILAEKLAQESGHPVYGTLRTVRTYQDLPRYVRDFKGLLSLETTGNLNIEGYHSSKVVKLFKAKKINENLFCAIEKSINSTLPSTTTQIAGE